MFELVGRASPRFTLSRRIAVHLLFVWLVGLTGCAVGPDFQKPKTPLPEAWTNAPKAEADQGPAASRRPAEIVRWWSLFDDPVLTSLIERAVNSNLDALQAKSRIRQARASRGVVASGLWPTLDASGSYRRSYNGVSSSAAAATERSFFQAGLDSVWELDIFGGVRRSVEASDADITAAVEDLRDVLVTLAAEAGTNYIELRGFQLRLAIAKRNLEAQRRTAEITRKRFAAGFVGALDVASARAQAAATESQIPSLEASAQAAVFSLSLLLGLEPTALSEELQTEAPIPPPPPEAPVGLPSELVQRRPDIRRAEARLHAATARIGAATADLFPKISLTGSFGFSSDELNLLTNWDSRSWSLGPSVSWSIFNAGKIRANIEVRGALEEQALLTYRSAVLTALKEVEAALVSCAKERGRRVTLAEAVTESAKAVGLAMELYTAGRTDFLNVLNAQRSLYIAEEALALSDEALAADMIALYKALGGGWEG